MEKSNFIKKITSLVLIFCIAASSFNNLSAMADQTQNKNSSSEDSPQELQKKFFRQNFYKNSYLNKSIISDNEWEELEIKNILEKWEKYTTSNFDKLGLEKIIRYTPEESKEILFELVNNEEIFKKTEEIINKLTAAQENICSYYQDNFQAPSFLQNIMSGLTGGLPLLAIKFTESAAANQTNFDKSKFLYSTSTFLKNIVSPIYAGLMMFGGFETVGDYFRAKRNNKIKFNFSKNLLWNSTLMLRSINPFSHVYKKGFTPEKEKRVLLKEDFSHKYLTAGDNAKSMYFSINSFFGNIKTNKDGSTKIGNNITKNIISSAITVPYILYKSAITILPLLALAYGSYAINKQHAIEQETLYNNLRNIGALLKSLDELENINKIKNTKFIGDIINSNKNNQQLIRLKELLDNPIFNENHNTNFLNHFSRSGTIKAINNELSENIWNLRNTIYDVSLLGGYLSIAKMIRESKNCENKYCFIENINSNTPFIELNDAWFPLIDQDKAVASTIKLGGENIPQNTIITGPNGGGKSITMLSIAFNVLLSKLGIAAASSAKVSDFARIATSIHPKHDPKNGDSCFMAESKRIENYIKKEINTTKGNILVILDEPYKGTSESAGADLIFEFGQYVAENKNCSAVIATHTERPASLKDCIDTSNFFKNYQIEIDEINPGEFKRTFKLSEGTANWWLKDVDKKRTRYIKWLMNGQDKSNQLHFIQF